MVLAIQKRQGVKWKTGQKKCSSRVRKSMGNLREVKKTKDYS